MIIKKWIYLSLGILFLVLFVFEFSQVFEKSIDIEEENKIIGGGNYYGFVGKVNLFHSLSTLILLSLSIITIWSGFKRIKR